MSLMPQSVEENSYINLRRKVDSLLEKCPNGNFKQIFRVVYSRDNAARSIEKMFAFEGMPTLKFLFKAKLVCSEEESNGCDEGSLIDDDYPFFDCCAYCGNSIKICFSVLNSGVECQAKFDLGIENPEKSITRVANQLDQWQTTKYSELANNEKFCADFLLDVESEMLLTEEAYELKEEGYFFSTDGNITFVLAITTNIPNPNMPVSALTLPEKSQYPGLLVKLAEQFSERYINADAPPDGLVDFIIHFGQNKIYCHKLVLSITSQYFCRMFESDMKETQNNEAHLDDIDLTTMKSLLEFMYHDEIDASKITMDLLKIADRFEVMGLRKICIETLRKNINFANVATVWENAYILNVEELTHDCVAFMTVHWETLAKDEDIIQLAKEYHVLPTTVSLLLPQK